MERRDWRSGGIDLQEFPRTAGARVSAHTLPPRMIHNRDSYATANLRKKNVEKTSKRPVKKEGTRRKQIIISELKSADKNAVVETILVGLTVPDESRSRQDVSKERRGEGRGRKEEEGKKEKTVPSGRWEDVRLDGDRW